MQQTFEAVSSIDFAVAYTEMALRDDKDFLDFEKDMLMPVWYGIGKGINSRMLPELALSAYLLEALHNAAQEMRLDPNHLLAFVHWHPGNWRMLRDFREQHERFAATHPDYTDYSRMVYHDMCTAFKQLTEPAFLKRAVDFYTGARGKEWFSAERVQETMPHPELLQPFYLQ
jgi:hypothetical protein